MSLETFVRVAIDDVGKRMRNISNILFQTGPEDTGTNQTVYQEVVTRAADDGTILDTMGWVETARDKYMRRLSEDTLNNLQSLVSLLGGPLAIPETFPTVPLGE